MESFAHNFNDINILQCYEKHSWFSYVRGTHRYSCPRTCKLHITLMTLTYYNVMRSIHDSAVLGVRIRTVVHVYAPSSSRIPQPRGSLGAPQVTSQLVSSIFLFATALWDLVNSRPVHSLILSSQLFFSVPCLLPPFTVPRKIPLARPDEREICPYHFSLRLFTMVRMYSCGPIACGSWHRLSRW